MEAYPALRIGPESGDHLRITVRGRVNPQCADFWDANWIHGSIELCAGAFRATIGSHLRTTEIASFREELQRLYAGLRGEAALASMETWISLRLTVMGTGTFRSMATSPMRRGWETGSPFRFRGWTRRSCRR